MDYKTRYIFVDESGDTAMFDKKHRPLPDVSKLFMIGLSIIDDPLDARNRLNGLRNQFLNDPYFKDIYSFKTSEKKTAIMLHAKDDIPELRWEMYKLLKDIPVKTAIVIRRKDDMKKDAQSIYQNTGKKLTDDIIYDNIVTTLFQYVSHKNGDYDIKFAVKKKPRNAALQNAILSAQDSLKQSGFRVITKINVCSDYSHSDACLQLIDYYLWAVHRLYIHLEDRYINMLRDNINVILDIDDTRNQAGGELYTRHNQIELKKIMPV
jgi:hypothetical protein